MSDLIAALDVGTNSFHLVIAKPTSTGFEVVTREREVIRLGLTAEHADGPTAQRPRRVGRLRLVDERPEQPRRVLERQRRDLVVAVERVERVEDRPVHLAAHGLSVEPRLGRLADDRAAFGSGSGHERLEEALLDVVGIHVGLSCSPPQASLRHGGRVPLHRHPAGVPTTRRGPCASGATPRSLDARRVPRSRRKATAFIRPPRQRWNS